jgi:hypothetical protein
VIITSSVWLWPSDDCFFMPRASAGETEVLFDLHVPRPKPFTRDANRMATAGGDGVRHHLPSMYFCDIIRRRTPS